MPIYKTAMKEARCGAVYPGIFYWCPYFRASAHVWGRN